MIIFDLDGTLADCEHRRHFVEINHSFKKGYIPASDYFGDKITSEQRGGSYHEKTGQKWKPDWNSFFEECDKDKPIIPIIEVFRRFSGLIGWDHGPFIWSERCESVREKTIEWLCKHLKDLPEYDEWFFVDKILKMRPIGDFTPDEQLKERWLDEVISEGKTIDMVFDDRKKVRDMWIRRGIFVFDVSQGKDLNKLETTQ